MKRIPEPDDLMDDAEQALAYAQEDFAEARELFLAHFARLHDDRPRGSILDLGCGPADIPLALAAQYPDLHIDAVDGAEAMLAHAREALRRQPGLAGRMQVICDYLPSAKLPRRHYDAVVSNSLLHHLHDPGDLWNTVQQCARSGAAICVMDLLRPQDETTLETLVTEHASTAPDVLRRDFRNSLYAAYTTDEVRTQLATAGLAGLAVQQVSDRHLLVAGTLAA
jgi:SAM-dependent methyltransferase